VEPFVVLRAFSSSAIPNIHEKWKVEFFPDKSVGGREDAGGRLSWLPGLS